MRTRFREHNESMSRRLAEFQPQTYQITQTMTRFLPGTRVLEWNLRTGHFDPDAPIQGVDWFYYMLRDSDQYFTLVGVYENVPGDSFFVKDHAYWVSAANNDDPVNPS